MPDADPGNTVKLPYRPPYTGPGAIVDLSGHATIADAADAMRRVIAGRGLAGVTNRDGERCGPARETEADAHYVVYGEPVG